MACKEVLRLLAKLVEPVAGVEKVGSARPVGPAAPVVRASRQYQAALAPRAEAE